MATKDRHTALLLELGGDAAMLGFFENLAVSAFVAQFEENGVDGYLFRRNGMGLGVAVSRIERYAFVEDFRRGWRVVFMVILLGMVALVGLDAIFTLSRYGRAGESSLIVPFAGLLPLAGTAIFLATRLNRAPVRALVGRPLIGAERTRREARTAAFARMPWLQISWPPLAIAFAVTSMAWRFDVLHGWSRLWLVLMAFTLVATAYAAAQKWRATTVDRSA